MKKFLKENRVVLLVFGILSVLYFTSRLYNIMSLPLFTDEAIYVRWGQIARFDANWRFISLTDGKQPSFVWLTIASMKLVHDPLLAARLVSVGAGFVSMFGLFLLTKELFKSTKIGIISSSLYLIYPMALVYDRMALYDSLVGTCMIWTIYFEVLLVRKLRLDLAFSLALVLGASVLTKTSGFLAIYLSPFSLLLLDTRGKDFFNKVKKWAFLMAGASILAYMYYSVLRLSPFFHIIDDKNAVFVYTFKEWLTHPILFFVGNLAGMLDWVYRYMTGALLSLVVVSFLFKPRLMAEKLYLLAWFIVPFTVLAMFGKVLYPRFIFFMTLFLLPLAAFSLVKLSETIPRRTLLLFLYGAIALVLLRNDFYIIHDFSYASIPYSDLEQYINGWPAGGGVKEIISYLAGESQKGKLYVATEGTFGSLPTYAMEIYLDENKNIKKRGIWPIPSKIPKDLVEKAKTIPVYFIFNQSEKPPFKWPVDLVMRYQKGSGNAYMSLYKVR